MFLIEEKKSYAIKVCPNTLRERKKAEREGKSALTLLKTGLAERLNDSMKYCHDCGAELVIEMVPYPVFKCSKCDCSVSEFWGYCPYCGEKKEAQSDYPIGGGNKL